MCAAKKLPPNLPTDAIRIMTTQTNQSAGSFSRADLRAHSREGEKCGQEEHDDEILALLPDVAGEMGVVRNNGTEKKCAEERVNANALCNQRRKEQSNTDAGKHLLCCFAQGHLSADQPHGAPADD